MLRPRLPAASTVLPRLERVAGSEWFTNFGPQERGLRERFAARLRVEPSQVAAAANATLGLSGAVAVLGGRRWLVPAFTFAATPASVLSAGADLAFGDVDEQFVLAPRDETYDGYMPVAPFGECPDLKRWSAVPRVVHDAAASLGNELDLSVMPEGHAVVFSLHATKVLGAGEGGIVVFGNPENAARFRAWTNFGFMSGREASLPGTNAKMSEIQACYAHAALDDWHRERGEWEAARWVLEQMATEVGIRLLRFGNGINPYAIVEFESGAMADHVISTLESSGVGTRRWWSSGCHQMPAYAHMADEAFPMTDRIASRTIGIPLFRGMTSGDVDIVRGALMSALEEAGPRRLA